jgi:basic membrane protein A
LTALVMGACGPRAQDCARADVLCVGLVTGFGTVSEGTEREAWLALQDAAAADLVDRIDRIETVDTRDRAANIDVFAARGYDVIVTVGASMSAATLDAAKQHPDLRFIGVEQPQPQPVENLTGLIFHEERSGFLAGALAALITETHRVAAVCEAEFVDQVRRYCDGFSAGATFVDPAVRATVSYRDGELEGLFNDAEWGGTEARLQVAEGADVVFAAGEETAEEALEAAAARGAWVIGAESGLFDRLGSAGPRFLTSAVNDVRSGVLDLLRSLPAGKLPAGEYWGRVGLEPLRDSVRAIPTDIRSKMLEIHAGLTDGSIVLDIPYTNPGN